MKNVSWVVERIKCVIHEVQLPVYISLSHSYPSLNSRNAYYPTLSQLSGLHSVNL